MNIINEKHQKNAKNMGFALISFAFVFYFFPDFALIDIFPDIVTYILLCIGVGKLSYLNDSVEQARKLFFRMIIVSVGKLVGIFITFSTGNSEEQSSLMLLMVFVFALLEAFTLIPAYINLFDGILYLGTRHDGTAVFGPQKDRMKKSASDKIKRTTVAFVIVKNLALVLPETASLSVSDNINSYKLSMYEFIPHFRILGMIVSLVFGIVWLVRICRYFKSLSRDFVFVRSLCDRYNTEILPNTKIFAERRISIACLFFGLAAAFAIDFYINGNNGYNIIPDVMVAVSAVFGFIMIKKYISGRLFTISTAISSIYGIVSMLNWKLISDFSYEYTAAQVRTDIDASRTWKSLVLMSAIEAVCFLAVATLIIIAINKIINGHTGYCVEHYTIDPEIKLRELHNRLRAPLYFAGAFAVLAAFGGVFRVWMFRYATQLADVSWIIEAMLTAVFAIVLIIALLRTNEEVKEKYMY